MNGLLTGLKEYKQILLNYISIIKYPQRLTSNVIYGIPEVRGKKDAKDFASGKNTLQGILTNKEWETDFLASLMYNKEFLKLNEGDTFVFGTNTQGVDSYSLVDWQGVNYIIYGKEIKILYDTDGRKGMLLVYRSNDDDFIYVYKTGITLRVYFARAGKKEEKYELLKFLKKNLPSGIRKLI